MFGVSKMRNECFTLIKIHLGLLFEINAGFHKNSEQKQFFQSVFDQINADLVSIRDLNDRVFSLKSLQEQPERSSEKKSTSASSQPSMCLLSLPQEHSGRETPVSVDSFPLEWDHTGDVGGSSSHDEEEDAAFFSALSGKYKIGQIQCLVLS